MKATFRILPVWINIHFHTNRQILHFTKQLEKTRSFISTRCMIVRNWHHGSNSGSPSDISRPRWLDKILLLLIAYFSVTSCLFSRQQTLRKCVFSNFTCNFVSPLFRYQVLTTLDSNLPKEAKLKSFLTFNRTLIVSMQSKNGKLAILTWCVYGTKSHMNYGS